MADRYIVKPIDLGCGVTAWHVLDSRVVGGGEPAFVARCGNEDDAQLVRDALNAWDEQRKGGAVEREVTVIAIAVNSERRKCHYVDQSCEL